MNNFYVIVPVYNEEKNIVKLLPKIFEFTKKIIVVNDGSKDKTAEILKSFPKLKTINLKTNQGKGAAMKVGAKFAWKLNADGIVFLDGDNQHDPKHLPKFFSLLKKGVDIIIGIRVLKADVPIYRKLGNKLLLLGVKLMFGVNLEDLLCGYRGYSKKGYKKVIWTSNNYGVETEVIALIGRKKLNYEKIIVDTIYLSKYKGFSIKDGLGILLKLPYWRFKKI